MFFAWFGLFDLLFLIGFVWFLRWAGRERVAGVIHAATRASWLPVELTHDRASSVASDGWRSSARSRSGLIWALVVTSLDAPAVVDVGFAAGWLLMPSTLVASLAAADAPVRARRPRVAGLARPPGGLSSAGCPPTPVAATGWLAYPDGGRRLGAGLGLWFWYRLLPVPAALDDPFSAGRWALVGAHIGLVVAGAILAAIALWQ